MGLPIKPKRVFKTNLIEERGEKIELQEENEIMVEMYLMAIR